jgi:preprotein translocase subunit SecG
LYWKLTRGRSEVAEEGVAMWQLPSWMYAGLNLLLFLTGLFLILLVLIQRGKGGGLSGALGGAGGSSAFGSRAGDTFTRITIYVAAIWLLMIMFLIKATQITTPLKDHRDDSGEQEKKDA